MNLHTLSLKKLTNGLLKNGSKEMTGRIRGIRIREAIEKFLGEKGEGQKVILDFSGIGPIDFSWADEVIAKIVSRLWSGEYGEKFILLRGLNPSQAENISVALERKRLAVLTIGPKGWRVIGSLNNYLVRTLHQVMKKRQLTLRELSDEEGIGMNTSGTRLLNLYKKRLVVRVEKTAKRGKEVSYRTRAYVYQSLLS
ncbi:MAG: STAS-like domain-containing protein [Thermodesulfobacteriota bacterium]